jgi:hypothetical protein
VSSKAKMSFAGKTFPSFPSSSSNNNTGTNSSNLLSNSTFGVRLGGNNNSATTNVNAKPQNVGTGTARQPLKTEFTVQGSNGKSNIGISVFPTNSLQLGAEKVEDYQDNSLGRQYDGHSAVTGYSDNERSQGFTKISISGTGFTENPVQNLIGTKAGTGLNEKITPIIGNDVLSANGIMTSQKQHFRTGGAGQALVPVQQQSSLVPSASQGMNSSEDPFLHITRNMQAQTQKISQLELQLREQTAQNQQYRSKLAESEEQAKNASKEILQHKETIARYEKACEHKDADLKNAQDRIGQLEADRSRMIDEGIRSRNSAIAEKRKLLSEVKRATEVILILQEVRQAVGAQEIPINDEDEKQLPSSVVEGVDLAPAASNIADKHRIDELSTENSALQYKLRDMESEVQHNHILALRFLEIGEQCPSCCEKMKAVCADASAAELNQPPDNQ